jgi:hypothetical protein
MSAQVKREIASRGKQIFAQRIADMGAEPYPQRLQSLQDSFLQQILPEGCL